MIELDSDAELTHVPDSLVAVTPQPSSVPLTPGSAQATLEAACETAGVSLPPAKLMRLGSNAVFRLENGVIARVGRGGHQRARTAVTVARWLEAEDFPAVRALPVEQPVVIDGRPVTFWSSVAETTIFAGLAEVAEVIRDLHELAPPSDLQLPELDPFGSGFRRLSEASGASETDRSYLTSRLQRLRQSYVQAAFDLPPGVIHGDASIGNVVRDDAGHPVLMDLDGFAIGPREWDLVLTALYFERFGWHSAEEYADFVRVYGYDVRTSPAYELLCDLRETLMVIWLAQKADDPEAAAEVRKRVESLRTNGSRRDWAPY